VIGHVLAPAGPQAARIGALFWLYAAVSAVVVVLVVGALLWAVLRRRPPSREIEVELPASAQRSAAERAIAPPDAAAERRLALGVGVAIAGSVITLFVLLVASVVTGRAMARFGPVPAMTIRLVGQQWWWEVQYEASQPSSILTTANEIHVPVGVPIKLRLTSRDVIHSFWVPSLHGKIDLIPGKETEITLQVDRPGVYRGQCAEFCGLEHAKMAILVVAEDAGAFEAWLAGQRRPAAEPATPQARRGRELFVKGQCAMCHTVRGTTAGATAGPDLTHLAGRRTLAAGTLPNGRGHLAGWIMNPQGPKPGARMPPASLPAKDLQDLLAFLEGLE
jgi:cytochrome c oxidase subunit 2